jgi:transcriptional regulator with XRE-family HTH domain
MKNRLNKAFHHLIGIGLISNQKDLADRMGYSRTSISKALNGYKDYLTESFMNKLYDVFPDIFNTAWLLTGKGPMLKEGIPETPTMNHNKGVPYYDVDFIGGFDLIHNDQTTRPAYYIDFEQYNKADCWCNVTGHSMEPMISNGDSIALKEIQDWYAFIPFGEIYAIVTTEHRTIKRVSKASNNDSLLLIPTNESPEYQPQEIPKKLIIKVFKVLGCVKKF